MNKALSIKITGILVMMLLLVPAVFSQVSIGTGDIPTAGGQSFHYYVQADTLQGDSLGIPVVINPPGGNYTWNFALGATEGVRVDTLINPEDAPDIDMFPNVSRVLRGGSLLGFMGTDGAYRYEAIADTGWDIAGLGVHLELDTLDINIPIPLDIHLSPMPLTYEAEWTQTDTFQYEFSPDTSDFTYMAEVVVGLFSECDAWGTVDYHGGSVEALRVHTNYGGQFNLYVWIEIWPLPGFWMPIPGIGQEIESTHMYTWVAPGFGEIANITSLAGEDSSQFSQASSISYMFAPDWSVPEDNDMLPAEISLSKAYPNPFNSFTRLEYSISRYSNVKLEVIDILGRQVSSLQNGPLQAGTYNTSWHAENNPSGIYFVRLSTPEASQISKVTLIK